MLSHLKSDLGAIGHARAGALQMCVLQCKKVRTLECAPKSDHAHSSMPMPPWRSVLCVYIVVLSVSLGSAQIQTLPALCVL